MELYNGIVCVSYSELTEGDAPVVKSNTLSSWLKRGKARHARKAYGQGVEALIEYHTLPAQVREAIVERYGNPEALKYKQSAEHVLLIDEAASRYYHYDYRYVKGNSEVRLPNDIADEYTTNASMMNAILRKKRELHAMRNRLGNSRGNIWEIVRRWSEQLRPLYLHTLPSSEGGLRRLCAKYEKEGYDALVSGKLGNRNTAVLDGDAAEYIIALKRSMRPRYSHSEILKRYNSECAEMGWKPLASEQSLRSYLYQPRVRRLWADAVVGELSTHDAYGYKFSGKAPSCRDAMWAADGTRLNLYYKAVGKDGRLRLATADVYVIVDVYSGAMLAYEIGEESKSEVQYRAFRRAVMYAEHRPYELVLDNQAGQRKLESQGFLGRVAHHVHFKTPYRKQANPIESIFGQFQQSVLRKHFYFTGANITAKGEEQRPNLEYIQANIEDVPDYKGLCEVYARETEEWNNSLHPATGISRIDTYRTSVNDQLTKLEFTDYVDMFWLERKKEITFTSSGLSITINGKKHEYDVYADNGLVDHKWRSLWVGYKFVVKYDPCDTSQVCLYSVDEGTKSKRFCTFASELRRVHRAMQDQADEDLVMIHGNLRADREERKERIIAGRAIDYRWGNKGAHPRVPTFSKEENEEIEAEALRRSGIGVVQRVSSADNGTARAGRIQLAQAVVAKRISSADWSEVLQHDRADDLQRRVYEKM